MPNTDHVTVIPTAREIALAEKFFALWHGGANRFKDFNAVKDDIARMIIHNGNSYDKNYMSLPAGTRTHISHLGQVARKKNELAKTNAHLACCIKQAMEDWHRENQKDRDLLIARIHPEDEAPFYEKEFE